MAALPIVGGDLAASRTLIAGCREHLPFEGGVVPVMVMPLGAAPA